MRVPIQRGQTGEGGWYVAIGTSEGWAQFLAQMGQSVDIWQDVSWDQEILVGALLGIRQGRGHAITITQVDVDGVSVRAAVSIASPPSLETASPWISYPFHLVRISRDDLPLGPVTFEFASAEGGSLGPGETLVSQTVDMIDLNILWLPGQEGTAPTATPLSPTLTPQPTLEATPVPNLQTIGTVLQVMPEALQIRLLPREGDWIEVELLEATSILFEDGRAATLAQLQPGSTINVLGYAGENGEMRAAHIDVVQLPPQSLQMGPYQSRDSSLSTLYGGYALPLSGREISTTLPLTQTFDLTQTQVLTQNGFVVTPARYDNWLAAYSDPARQGYPVFVSADSILHLTNLIHERTLHSTERNHLLPELTMLDREMFDRAWTQYQAVASATSPEEQRIATTSLQAASYFAVPLALLDPGFVYPEIISPVVQSELALIVAGEAVTITPLLDVPGVPQEERPLLDYGQFVPTGYYARDPALGRYYQALTWHQRYPLRPGQRREIRLAAMITLLLDTDPTARVLWERICTVLSYFHGSDASYTPRSYAEAIEDAWEGDLAITALADEGSIDRLTEAVDQVPLPDNPIWTFWGDSAPDRDWRFFSPAFKIDAYVFDQMTSSEIGPIENPRLFPTVIDLAAVLGSLEAYDVADQIGAANREGYLDQIGKVRNELSALRVEHWTSDLYSSWLYAQRAMIESKTTAYPEWMRTSPWRRKDLQTLFAGWTHYYDATGTDAVTPVVLPSEAEADQALRWGYVEPQPQLYARLSATTRQLIDGLEGRMMLSRDDQDDLLKLEAWLLFVQDVARRELTGQALSDQDYQQLGNYGAVIQDFERAPIDGEPRAAPATSTALVTLTSVGADHLNEAVGYVDEIYVVVERNRQQYLARGGVYSHYEYTWSSPEPMTEALWLELLQAQSLPPRPPWVSDFVVP
jgi:hypothetical protein